MIEIDARDKKQRALALMTNWQRTQYSRALASWRRKERKEPDPVQFAIMPRPGTPLPEYLRFVAYTNEVTEP
jgi:hypothetical protein